MGTAVNCNSARLYMPLDTPVKFVCFDLDWGGGNWDQVNKIRVQAEQDGHVYVLGEDYPIVSESQLPMYHRVVESFARPGGHYSVKLYRIDFVEKPADAR